MNTRPSSNRINRLNNRLSKTLQSSRPASLATPVAGLVRWVHKPGQFKSHRPSGVSTQTATEAITSTDQTALLRQQAMTKAKQGDRVGAIKLFSEVIKRNPESAMDYNNRGLVYFQNGQMEAALADYDRALDLNPCLDSVYNNRANYYAALGEYLDAILDYEIAIELNPANVRAWINQGITLRELQMYERAIESFDLALHLGRLEGHIYAERGRTYHLWGDWNCAVSDYHRALVQLSDDAASPQSIRLKQQVTTWLNDLLHPGKG